MKKIVYLAVCLLLISSLATIGIGTEAGEKQTIINVDFSNLEIIESNIDNFLEIRYNGAGGCLYQTSEPILPRYTTKLTFPFGTKIVDVDCEIGQVNTMDISDKIVPAPTPVNPGIEDSQNPEYILNEQVYEKNDYYPYTWFEYSKHSGLDENGNHKMFLNIQGYPVQYNPISDKISYVDGLDFTIIYKDPETNPFPETADNELVIIAPSSFSGDIQKLVTHKTNMGVSTLLKTTEEIYSEYPSGYDKPEKIKLFIKDAIETFNTKYILLIGGLDSYLYGDPRENRNEGTKDWHVPVRYSNLKEVSGGLFDPGLISDLYFADIYDGEGEFSSWDSNDDKIYAKWTATGRDMLDCYPDVYVGRLACRNNFEVKIMVNKIINYEKNTFGQSWYNKMIVIGGDSHNDPPTHYIEGEVVADKILDEYMTEFTPVKVYASYKTSKPSYVPTKDNIKREIGKGAGHLFLDGHANPFSWITHFPREFDGWIPNGGLDITDMPLIFNLNKLPVCCVEGCHNSQFNVSILYAMSDKKNDLHSWCYGLPVPECWSWWLTRKVGGGSIATIGNTGLGYGAVGEHGDLDNDNITEPDTVEALGGYWFLMFYEAFDEGAQNLGEAWAGAITKYLDTFPPMKKQADTKTVQQLCLLGDPSLMIGGYPSGDNLKAEIVDGAAGIVGVPDEDMIFKAQAFNGDSSYSFAWDFDGDGVYDDAQGDTSSYKWTTPGVYWISLKVSDGTGAEDIYDTIVSVEIGASTPVRPIGETRIESNVKYTYQTDINTQSGYWNKIYYKFSWGDGTESDWLESSSASHIWTKKGVYQIKAKALLVHETIDENDIEDLKETSWSSPLTISLSRSSSTPGPLFRLLQYLFEKYPNAFPIMRLLIGQ
jgi:hypothetical protein